MANNWFAEQWRQIQGNVKWDFIKLAGASGLAAAYVLLQKVRHLPFDWIVVAVLFALSLAAFLYLGRGKAGISQSTNNTQSSATSLSTGAGDLDATNWFRNSYYSPLQAEAEERIRKAAAQSQPNDKEGFYAKFIAIGVIAYTYDQIWWTIFRSQLLALLHLNRSNGLLSVSQMKTYYDQAVTEYPDLQQYPFDQWLNYMTANVWVIRHPSDMVEITVRGKDFLKYLVHWGREPNQRIR